MAMTTGATLALGAATAGADVRRDPHAARPTTAEPHAATQGVAAADALVRSHDPALFRGADDRLVRRSVQSGTGGLQYMAYDRVYKGLPVVGGDVVVVTDLSGQVRSTSVALRSVVRVDTAPLVGPDRATAAARGRLARVDRVASHRLAVLAWDTPRLVWEVVVEGSTATAPSRLHAFVDARTGQVVDSYDDVRAGSGNGYYNGPVTISTSGSGSSWSMSDSTRSGLRCGGQNGSAYTGTDDAWGNGSGTNLETACVDALYAAQKEWDMLRGWFNRDGFTGNGTGPPARVGLNAVNAYWNGSYTNFGHSSDNQRQVTPIDVVAHEYGHAIFQYTPGGSGSGNENGGINEGTGDIFGALVEAFANNPNDPPDYLVGEEVNLTGSGPIRNMYNPSLKGDPNCWSTSIPNTEVHAAAGPLNHWFYLVAEGSSPGGGKPNSPICSGGPSSVTGIDIRKAGEVYYNALLRKTSTWRYANVRLHSLQAVVQLYGANSAECNTVKNAWNAVSVPAQSGEPACGTAPGNDFSMLLNPPSGTLQAGQTITTTLSTQTTSGSAQVVTFSASGLPAGATVSFDPTSVQSGGSSTMTIATTSSTASGTYQVTIKGDGTSVDKTAVYSLTVQTGQPPTDDFAIAVSPTSATVTPGQSTTATIATTVTSGGAQKVVLSASGAPSGVTVGFDPVSIPSGESSTMTIVTTSAAAAGTYTIDILGDGAVTDHTVQFRLTIDSGQPPTDDFSMTVSPTSATVTAGQSTSATVATTVTSGGAQKVSLAANGVPNGVTVGFNPASIPSGESSTMTIATTSAAAAGTYTIDILGDGAVTDHTVQFRLTIQSGQPPGRTFTNDTNHSIYDFWTVRSWVRSTATGPATSPVRLSVTISHSCAEDLHIHLVAPDRTSYHVKSSTYGTCTRFGTRTYDVMVNEDAEGTWVLEVTDDYRYDEGYLDRWSITL